MYVLIADVEKILNTYKPGPFRQLGNGFGRLMGGSHHLGDHSLVKNLHELIYGTSFYERNRMYVQQRCFKRPERIHGSLIADLLAQYPTKEGTQSRVVADSLRRLIAPVAAPIGSYDFYQGLILDYIGRNLDDEDKDRLRFDIPVSADNDPFAMVRECNALALFYWGLSNRFSRNQTLAETRLVQIFNKHADQQAAIKQVILGVLARVLNRQSCGKPLENMPILALFLVLYMDYASYQFKSLQLFQFHEFYLLPADVLASVLKKSCVQELHFDCIPTMHDVPADFWALLNRVLEDSMVSMIRVSFYESNEPDRNSQIFRIVWARTTIMQCTVSALPLWLSVDYTEQFFDSLGRSPVEMLIFENYGPAEFLCQDQVRALARVLPHAKFTTFKFILDIASPLFLEMLEDWRALFQSLPRSQVTTVVITIAGFLDAEGGTAENRAVLAELLVELQVHIKSLGFRDIAQFDQVSDIQWQAFLAIFEDSKITSVPIKLENSARRAQLEKLIAQNVRRSFVDMESGSLQHTIAHRLWQRPGAAIIQDPATEACAFASSNVSSNINSAVFRVLKQTEEEYAARGVRYVND